MEEFSTDDYAACLRVLQAVADDPALTADDERFKGLVAKVNRSARRQLRRESAELDRSHDRLVRESTLRCQADPVPAQPDAAPVPAALRRTQRCYICKEPYARVHHRYHLLCPACAAENEARRSQHADLQGRIALLTGGRIKIGLQTGLFLLRSGATLHLTTRFPENARRAYAVVPDAAQWLPRLHIHALDLRNIPLVEEFAAHLRCSLPYLDILINNAAQTIRRPLAWYRELLDAETDPPVLLEAVGGHALPLPAETLALFPAGERTAEGQPLDLRAVNSWRTALTELSTPELLEVQLVNAIAPCLLIARLQSILQRSPHARRFIVNVSAMEGQFSWQNKTPRHPHTNMAKAALNMLTRTSAQEFARDGIFMNSVDTGWITQENPHAAAVRQRSRGFVPPLDVVDGAARIVAPIVDGLSAAEPPHGLFFKDYRPHPW
jgi:NAD(P)-dependent dehydrogenase (short-subunit alcohol dehydrogenase family)